MKASLSKHAPDLPFKAVVTAERLGKLVSTARRARAWTQDDLAAKADVSRISVARAESGDTRLALHLWLKMLWACDQLERLDEFLDPAKDETGATLAIQSLPTRVRRGK